MTTDAATLITAPGLDFEQPLVELDARRRVLEQTTDRTQEQGDEAAAQLVARFALVVREGVLSHGHVDDTRGGLHARCSR